MASVESNSRLGEIVLDCNNGVLHTVNTLNGITSTFATVVLHYIRMYNFFNVTRRVVMENKVVKQKRPVPVSQT